MGRVVARNVKEWSDEDVLWTGVGSGGCHDVILCESWLCAAENEVRRGKRGLQQKPAAMRPESFKDGAPLRTPGLG